MTERKCQVVTLFDLLMDPVEPKRCGAPASEFLIMRSCAKPECPPYNCQGHDVCDQHAVALRAEGMVKTDA